MNKPDFLEWMDYAMSAMPSLKTWVTKSGIDVIAVHWIKALEDVELKHAKEFIDALMRGDADEPKGFTKFPAACRSWSLNAQREASPELVKSTIDGEPVFDCPACEDRGTRLIVATDHENYQRCVEAYYADRLDRTIRTQAVACHCRAGNRYRRPKGWSSRKPLASFQEGVCIEVATQAIGKGEHRTICDWLEKHRGLTR